MIHVGTEIPCNGPLAEVIHEQKPVLLPDLSQERCQSIPQLASYAPQSVGRSTYLFPVSTAHKRYGILALTKERGQVFLPEDVEATAIPGFTRCRRVGVRSGKGSCGAVPT